MTIVLFFLDMIPCVQCKMHYSDRFNNREVLNLKTLHDCIYQLLCEIDDICNKYNIRYYLHAGTVIGAVRHRGVIPWDDDIDIAMERCEYEKFSKIIESLKPKNRVLVTPEKYPDYKFTYPQYKDTSTSVFYRSGLYTDFPLGCFIDIMILDPIKDDDCCKNKHSENLKLLTEIRSDYYVVNRSSNYTKYKIYKKICEYFGKDKVVKYLEKKLLHPETECDGYIQRVGLFTTYWDKKFFQQPEYKEINGRLFPVPTYVEEYLRYTYGDSWMYFPDVAGKADHGFTFLPNLSMNVCRNDYRPYINILRYKNAFKRYKHWRFKAIKFENSVKFCNTLRMSELFKLIIENKVAGIDLKKLYDSRSFEKLEDVLHIYYKYQLNSRFFQDRIAIEVRKEIVYYACMLLILKGEYFTADKIIGICDYLKDTSEYEEICQLIEITRELSIAIYEEHYNDVKIKELVDSVLPKYSCHVDFIAAKCYILLKYYNDIENVKKICNDALTIYLKHPVLLKNIADAEYKGNNIEKALSLYQEAYHLTNNGMMRLAIADILTDNKVSNYEEYNDKVPDLKIYNELVETAQSKIFKLLQELDKICAQNNINYFLGGYLAAEAVELESFAPECCSAYIVLHPLDREKFYTAVSKSLGKNRFLEAFENNGNYPDFSMRYGDTDTVVFDLREEGFYKYPGLNITVLFMQSFRKNKWLNKLNMGLYAAVEATAFPSVFINTTKKKILAGMLMSIPNFLFGKKLTKKLVWNIIYYNGHCGRTVNGYIKTYWVKHIYIPVINFNEYKLCKLNDSAFKIPKNYSEYIKPQIRGNWNNGKAVGKLLKGNIIAAMNVNCTNYMDSLKKINVKNEFFYNWSKLVRCNNKCSSESWYATNYAWEIAMRTYERFRLWQKYAPLKKEIISLYKNDKIDQLRDILSDYIEQLEKYAPIGVAIIFDETIFRITWDVLQKDRKLWLIKSILNKIPPAHLNPILLSCGEVSDMKKAVNSDEIINILEYLDNDVENCLYMYADIEKYGLENDNMSVWYDTDEIGIRMVVMKYHNNFQVYSNRGFYDLEGVIELINQYNPNGISGRKEIIVYLQKYLSEKYHTEYGVIFRGKAIDKEKIKSALADCDVCIELAKAENAKDIAELVCMDEELGSVYTVESLAAELSDRINTGMGRSYIIRDNGKVVAHNATYAESEKFVVVSGLMVHPEFRDTEYAYWIDLKSSLEFQEEGKDRYFFALRNRIIKWHKRIGNIVVGEYGKMSIVK